MDATKFVYIPEWALTVFKQGQGLVKVENVQLSDKWKDAF